MYYCTISKRATVIYLTISISAYTELEVLYANISQDCVTKSYYISAILTSFLSHS